MLRFYYFTEKYLMLLNSVLHTAIHQMKIIQWNFYFNVLSLVSIAGQKLMSPLFFPHFEGSITSKTLREEVKWNRKWLIWVENYKGTKFQLDIWNTTTMKCQGWHNSACSWWHANLSKFHFIRNLEPFVQSNWNCQDWSVSKVSHLLKFHQNLRWFPWDD